MANGPDAPLEEWFGVQVDAVGRVERLYLDENELSGMIPPEVGELANLERLYLDENNLSGTIPPEVGELANLERLYLDENDLSGTIPPEVGELANLERLYLDENNLSGTIPPEVGELANLERLYLDENNLSGTIPPEIGALASLERLRLNENELAGPIPAELGDLASLTQLRMAVNQLTGRLPPELANLASLEQMSLAANRLEGPIPPEFGGLANLTRLELGNNARMTGPLPMGLTGLRLSVLTAGGTDLCAPPDPDFQAWLRGVHTRWIEPCIEAERPAAYLTQTVQSWRFPVPLVAGEKALLRVFPIARQATSEGLPLVRARFYLNDRETHVANIPATSSPIPTEVNEASLSTSANVEIPGHIVQPSLEMVVEIDPDRMLDPALGVAKRIPETGRLAVEVAAMPPLDLTLIPFLWSENPDPSITDLIEAMAADPENHEMLRDIHTLLPVHDLAVTAHEPVLTSENRAGALLSETRMIRAMEGGTGHYMGMMHRHSLAGSTVGLAGRPGRESFSRVDAGTMAHELGHNFSLGHATRCDGGFDSDPSYPYPSGFTGSWGFDFRNGTLVPPTAWDLMAPGGCRPRLIGDYSFTNALRYRLYDEGAPAAAAVVRSLLIWGGISADAVPFLQPAFVVDAPAVLPETAGEYLVVGRGVDGAELFSLSFTMPDTADGDGSSSFAFVLPVQPHWEGGLGSVTLSGPDGSISLDRNSDQPMVILRDPRSGQVRGIVRDLPEADAAALAPQAGSDSLDVLFSRGIPDVAAWR